MKEWPEKTLGEFVLLQRGHDLPTDSRGEGKIPVVGSFGITGYHNVAKAKGPGVTVGRSGASAGTVVYVDQDYWPHNTCLFVKDFFGNNPRFAYYLLSTLDLASHAAGSAQPSLNRNHIAPLPLSVPDRAEQDDIASVLSALDEKIELNRRMNETLEALAQAIFKDWFVTFGPAHRKMEGTTNPVAILGGLIPDAANAAPLAALFPSSFGEDGLPEGWEEATLDAVCTVNDESWKASNHPAEVNYVDLSNTKWGVIEATSILSWEKAPSRARRIARSGDTIVGTVRPGNGSFAFISNEGYTVSTGFAVLRPKQPQYASFVYIASTRPENIERLANLADSHGGAYPAVNPSEVTSTQFSHPGDPILFAFDQIVGPFRDRIEHNKNENLTLAETRDYLLPKLMSGAVRVRNVDALAG